MPLRRFVFTLGALALLTGIGTAGYRLIEGWSVLDSLYMTVITLSTVGFMEIHPLSDAGHIFTMLLILGGVFTFLYGALEVIRSIVSGEVRGAIGRQRMERSLAELNNHLIVCGFGRMGRLVCEEFSALKLRFVAVEREAARLVDFNLAHGLALTGDATSDETLRKAGIERARALVSVVASDADNLFITMSARFLNDKLFIVARAENEAAEKKLLRAGASRVVSPYLTGGHRIAMAVVRPSVLDFIEVATRSAHLDLQMEEVEITAGSALAGQTLVESKIRQNLGIIIVAIRKSGGRMVFNPESDVALEPHDILITLGKRHQLDRLEKLALGG